MFIDLDRKYVLTKHSKVKGKVKVTKSDHNPIYLIIDLPWETKLVKPRVEIFNLRNIECQANYLEYTNNSNILTQCLINRDIKVGGKLWLKNMNFIIHSNFRKIRMNGKSMIDKNIEELYCERTQLADNSAEMEAKDKLITEKIWERNRAVIVEQISEISDASCNLSRVKKWNN